jgi:hypothetical protein
LPPPCALSPPSIAISAPLTNEDSSEIRNTTSGATSSAWATRPSGVASTLARRNASGAVAVIGVSMKPGKIAFDRMPRGPSSRLATRESARMPHLLIA